MATFKTTEKMRTARKAAMARLRAMSYEELLEHSLANQNSVTVAFLSSCQSERPFVEATHQPVMVMQESYTISTPTQSRGVYQGGGSLAAAAASFCAQALQPACPQNTYTFSTAA